MMTTDEREVIETCRESKTRGDWKKLMQQVLAVKPEQVGVRLPNGEIAWATDTANEKPMYWQDKE